MDDMTQQAEPRAVRLDGENVPGTPGRLEWSAPVLTELDLDQTQANPIGPGLQDGIFTYT